MYWAFCSLQKGVSRDNDPSYLLYQSSFESGHRLTESQQHFHARWTVVLVIVWFHLQRALYLLCEGTWEGEVVMEEMHLLRWAGTCCHFPPSHKSSLSARQRENKETSVPCILSACWANLKDGRVDFSSLSPSCTSCYSSTYSPPPGALSRSGVSPLPGCSSLVPPVLAQQQGTAGSPAPGWLRVPTRALPGQLRQPWWVQSWERPWLSAGWVPFSLVELAGLPCPSCASFCATCCAKCRAVPLLTHHALFARSVGGVLVTCAPSGLPWYVEWGSATVAPAHVLSGAIAWAGGSW